MTFSTPLIATLLLSVSLSSSAIELSDITKSTPMLNNNKESSAPSNSNALVHFAAKQLNLPESTVKAGFGSLLKVAQNSLSEENFALITKAIPDAQSYLAKAPKLSVSSISSLLSSTGDSGKKADSLNYLNTAFNKLGIPKEQIPTMINSLTGYISQSGYGDASEQLNKALSFL